VEAARQSPSSDEEVDEVDSGEISETSEEASSEENAPNGNTQFKKHFEGIPGEWHETV